MASIKKIQSLIPYLPKRDIKYAQKFMEIRDFESLMEIIDSDIYLVRQNETKEVPKEEYKNISIHKLFELKAELALYMSMLNIPEDNDPTDYDFYERII